MKKLLLAVSILFCAAATMTSCNNGDYDANPATDNSGVKNPLDSLNTGGGSGGGSSSFNWNGTDPLSAKIDGAAFQATLGDVVTFGGFTIVTGTAGNQAISIQMPPDPAAGTVISLGSTSAITLSTNMSSQDPTTIYSSSFGGSGGIKILENDANHIKGLFYFTGRNTASVSKTISEGYFNINK